MLTRQLVVSGGGCAAFASAPSSRSPLRSAFSDGFSSAAATARPRRRPERGTNAVAATEEDLRGARGGVWSTPCTGPGRATTDDLRADPYPQRQHLHPLPAGGRRGRRSEAEVHDGRHVPVGDRVRRTSQEGARRKDATVYRFAERRARRAPTRGRRRACSSRFRTRQYLVEVFDPSPARARQLVKSGQVQLIRSRL